MGTDTGSDDASGTRERRIRLGRILFGLGVALQASEDFRDMEDNVEYAESAGVPMLELLAPFASGTMVAGGAALALWRPPRLATGAASRSSPS